MSLREYVHSLTFSVEIDASPLPPSRAAEAVHSIANSDVILAEPKPSRIDQLESLLQVAAKVGRFDFLRRDWRDIPWVMWRTPSDAPVSDSEAFLDRLGKHILRSEMRPRLLPLIRTYISEFDEARLGTRRIGPLLRSVLADDPRSFASKWRELDADLNIFDPARAPKTLALRVLEERRLDGALSRIGIDAGRMQDRLIRRSFEESIPFAAPSLRTIRESTMPADADFVFTWNSNADGTPRYAGTPSIVASAFLEAVADAPHHDPDVERDVLRRLIRWLGDPRLEAQRWLGVSGEALRYARRLLIAETLDAFFAILDKYAEPVAWRRRREFWEKYHKNGHITESWVAFGPLDARREARQKQIAHAKLEDSSSPKRSVMLLAFRDFVVAEASENGYCRFFKRSQMFHDFYAKELDYGSMHRRYSDRLAHTTYGWEERIAGKIYRATQIMHPQYGKGDA